VLEDFKDKRERIQESKDREACIPVRWNGQEEQPKGWRSDINDGARSTLPLGTAGDVPSE